MLTRKQPRRISRELTLLSLSQIRASERLEHQELNKLVLAAIRTLSNEVQETLETAAEEAKRGSDRLASSEWASNVNSARVMIDEALELTQTAINRLGAAVELPELIQLANQQEVRQYAVELIGLVKRRREEIDRQIEAALVDWQFSRLPKIDQDILRIAVAEILFLGVKDKIAINEAVELAKRYSDEDGYRFLNGVLRRVMNRLNSHP
ncbi:MAG: transcription antitermination factor NusB [Cyanophyceae cyanobacterium]